MAADRSTFCSLQRNWVQFPEPLWQFSVSASPVLRDLMPSSGFRHSHTHVVHIYIAEAHTHTHAI